MSVQVADGSSNTRCQEHWGLEAPENVPALAGLKVPTGSMEDPLGPFLGSSWGELAEVAAKFSAASRAFETATSRLDAAARSNHDAADTLRQASDRLGGRLAVLQQSTAALRTGLAHHTDASSALTTAAATLQSVGPQLGRAADQVRLSASAMEVTADRLTALQRASGGADAARLVPALEALLAQLEKRS